jgi:hypothetical protein
VDLILGILLDKNYFDTRALADIVSVCLHRCQHLPWGGVPLAWIGEGVAASEMDKRVRASAEGERCVGVGKIGSLICWPNRYG